MRYFAFKLLALAMLSFSAPLSAFSEKLYFPSTDRDWDTVTPESLGRLEQGKLKIEQPVADFLGAGWSKAAKV